VKQSVYFFLCGMTRDISLISSKTGSLPVAALAPVADGVDFVFPFVPFEAGLLVSSSSSRRFFDAGSKLEGGMRLET
jgi:hypothetical protein